MKTDSGYAYNARHGEYLPADALIAEEWYGDEDELATQPAWVTPELIEGGFGEGPLYECYVRFECDEAGLMTRIRSLYDNLVGGPFGADDDTYDYWPSGALLFQSMSDDIKDVYRERECHDLREQLIANIHGRYDGDQAAELLERCGLDGEPG